MKVILRKNIDTLGKIGQVVEVSDGYGINYLVPRKYAYLALAGNVKSIDEEKRVLIKKTEKDLNDATTLATEMSKLSFQFDVKVGEEDKMFGSITAQMIAERIKEKGYDIDRRKIELEEPIKSLGSHIVSIKIYTDVYAKITIWAVAEVN